MTTTKKIKDDQLWAEIDHWWQELQSSSGDRAHLRRAKNAQVVAMQPCYLRLLNQVKSANTKIHYRLPIIAGVLSHIKQDASSRVAYAMGASGSEKAVVSDLRFRRLLRIENDDDLYLNMIRVIRMLGGRANVRDMAKTLYYWNDRTKKEWASLYYLRRNEYENDENNTTGEQQ